MICIFLIVNKCHEKKYQNQQCNLSVAHNPTLNGSHWRCKYLKGALYDIHSINMRM